MWGESDDKDRDLRRAVLFTGNHRLYGKYMLRVVNEWPISCGNALSNKSIAWIGHAAAALALRIPENIVRQAWGQLTDEQREKANEQASNAIGEWRRLQDANSEPHKEVGAKLL